MIGRSLSHYKITVVPIKLGSELQPGLPQVLFAVDLHSSAFGTGQYDVLPDSERFVLNRSVPRDSEAMTLRVNWQQGLE